MHESTPIEPNKRGYETSDANLGAIGKYGIGLAVVCGLALIFMFMMLQNFRANQRKQEPPLSPMASQRETLPPEPRLQIQPNDDWLQYKAREDSLLQSYGWVSREAGVVRLPIDRALELVAQRGLPAKGEEKEAQTAAQGSKP